MIIKSRLIDRFAKEADELIAKRNQGEDNDAVIYSVMPVLIDGSRIILFEQEQALAFAEASREYTDFMAFKPPFEYTLIWFSQPMPDGLTGIMAIQAEFEQGEWDTTKMMFGISSIFDREIKKGEEINTIHAIYPDRLKSITWISSNNETRFVTDKSSDADIRNLAIACIGYINCENIRIEPQRTNPTINAKRQRKSKAIFDDYYLCHIRGVDYDKHATGAGSTHGFRYDVRGHFRRLNDGRMTWIRSHQRGLANEIYRPKQYDVE